MNGLERQRCRNCEKPAWRGGEKDFALYNPFCSWGCQQEARDRRIAALDLRADPPRPDGEEGQP